MSADPPRTRYAIYYTPPPGPLAAFGAAWLGWDPVLGTTVPHPEIGLPVAELTKTPRKYGLHGTIKPPFHLAPGTTFADLLTKARKLCAAQPPLDLPPLHLDRIGRFLALTIAGEQAPLARLAATVVKDLDPFRAPPSEAELDKRRKANLTPAQDANLTAWGYPYVMDEFRFHITLTGRLQDPASAAAALRPHVDPLLEPRTRITDLTLLASDEAGRFHERARLPLGG
ncbi:DUF1045 domain-containing protein [Pseudaestuariivita atlantica]|uniref:Phosphonate metabolism protein n=1 Tax=Pseudaestuariivita atlantica TaxID=1317121 RepID=A0A0L1JNZ6_9RHOB|nr:DUF1045 domain-containing protein [Pseudaestuariivita atlantica]KNG93456.1 phosphonate metabolism protein [Pseudaestuariivita atlantica]